MGGGRETTRETTTQQTEQTPEERELNRLLLERTRASQPGQIEAQGRGLDLINLLLSGEDLPGNLEILGQGLSEDVIGNISRQAVRDIQPSFQSSGILDSGVAAAVSGQVAGDVRRAASEFNIGVQQNLLNQALGGQAQVQQPLLAQQAQLGNQLAGLRSFTQQSRSQASGPNPFFQAFQTSLGQGLGQGAAALPFALAACWVASELFGGWSMPKTVYSRLYVMYKAPAWFRQFYIKHGKAFASFIKNKPVIKNIIRPLFELFAKRGKCLGGSHG